MNSFKSQYVNLKAFWEIVDSNFGVNIMKQQCVLVIKVKYNSLLAINK